MPGRCEEVELGGAPGWLAVLVETWWAVFVWRVLGVVEICLLM